MASVLDNYPKQGLRRLSAGPCVSSSPRPLSPNYHAALCPTWPQLLENAQLALLVVRGISQATDDDDIPACVIHGLCICDRQQHGTGA